MSDNDSGDVIISTPIITPNDMPGASPAPEDPAPAAPEAEAPRTATDEEPVDEAKWRALVKQWKTRAQENFEKAKKFDETELAKKSLEERLIAERDSARAEAESARQERLREKVARETSVPPEQIHGDSEEAMRESADKALAWANSLKKSTTPATPPASVVTGDGRPPSAGAQIQSRDELKNMTPQQILQADKDGRLNQLKGILK